MRSMVEKPRMVAVESRAPPRRKVRSGGVGLRMRVDDEPLEPLPDVEALSGPLLVLVLPPPIHCAACFPRLRQLRAGSIVPESFSVGISPPKCPYTPAAPPPCTEMEGWGGLLRLRSLSCETTRLRLVGGNFGGLLRSPAQRGCDLAFRSRPDIKTTVRRNGLARGCDHRRWPGGPSRRRTCTRLWHCAPGHPRSRRMHRWTCATVRRWRGGVGVSDAQERKHCSSFHIAASFHSLIFTMRACLPTLHAQRRVLPRRCGIGLPNGH